MENILSVNFELFEEMKGVKAVHLAMTKELARASQMKSYDIARTYMQKVIDRYEDFGANDTEPTWKIDDVLSYVFEEE